MYAHSIEKTLPCDNHLKRLYQHFHTLASGTTSGNRTNVIPCVQWTFFFLQHANMNYFLNKHTTDKSTTEKDHKTKEKIVIPMKTKPWGDVIERFLPSSHKWLEFTYVDYFWLVLRRGSFARCYVLCEWASDHLSGNWDEHFMLLGGPWKIPRSNKKEQIGDATRHI